MNNIKEMENSDMWTSECEDILAEWSEKASCYRWLHGRSEKKYKSQYHWFSIPVIILSTLTGAANVGMDSFVPVESKPLASAIVGGVNIIAGIISTLQNFLKVAELMESHRIAGVSWGKLGRNISIELSLDPSRRVIQSDFLKLSRAEYDRLIEAGPIIDDDIINQFNKKFKNYEVSIPSICNGLDECSIYRINNKHHIKEDYIDGIEDIISTNEGVKNKMKLTTNSIALKDTKTIDTNTGVSNDKNIQISMFDIKRSFEPEPMTDGEKINNNDVIDSKRTNNNTDTIDSGKTNDNIDIDNDSETKSIINDTDEEIKSTIDDNP